VAEGGGGKQQRTDILALISIEAWRKERKSTEAAIAEKS